MPRRPIGDRAQTSTERSRVWRQRRQAELDALKAELERLRQPDQPVNQNPVKTSLPSQSVTD